MDDGFLERERQRIEDMKGYEHDACRSGARYIAGIDEAGRGPIAGPVVAAAVILPPDFFLPRVDDSKKVAAQHRSQLAAAIKKEAVAWSIVSVNPPCLDRINILNATREAMRIAVLHLTPPADFLLIDAVKLSDINIRQRSIIKGDSLSVSIACASILAKVERDNKMEAYEDIYPGYGFARHKGYATREHLEAIAKIGICPIHRASFEPVKSILSGGNYGEQPGLFDQDYVEYKHSG